MFDTLVKLLREEVLQEFGQSKISSTSKSILFSRSYVYDNHINQGISPPTHTHTKSIFLNMSILTRIELRFTLSSH